MTNLKRIAYIAYLNDGPEGGVFKKLADTISIWKKHQIEAKLFIISQNLVYSAKTNRNMSSVFNGYHFTGLIRRWKSFNNLATDVINFNPNLIYFRYQSYCPGYSKLAKKIPIVIEINSDENIERWQSNKLSYIYNLFTKWIMIHKSRGLVFVSNELAMQKIYRLFKKKHLVLGNGIDTDRIRSLPPSGNRQPELVFIGTPNIRWHGLDKIILLAKAFPEWKFHLIGPNENELEFINLENVFLYGFLREREYIPILEKCDVAIGTLALHRKGYSETSSLKLLEYLARGLPVIQGYLDNRFTEPEPFILCLPNIEDNIEPNLTLIKTFVEKWTNKRVNTNSFLARISSDQTESRRLRFLTKI